MLPSYATYLKLFKVPHYFVWKWVFSVQHFQVTCLGADLGPHSLWGVNDDKSIPLSLVVIPCHQCFKYGGGKFPSRFRQLDLPFLLALYFGYISVFHMTSTQFLCIVICICSLLIVFGVR